MKPCDWCGHEHDQTALCTKRPRWSRRGFLCMAGLGAIGMAMGGLPTGAEITHAQWMTILVAVDAKDT